MNILLINYEYPPIGGGAGNATRFLARALVRLGHRVSVLTAAFKDDKGISDDYGVELIRIPCKRSDASQASIREMADFVFQAFKQVKTIAQSRSIESLILYFTIPCGPLAWWLKKKLNIPYIISLRGGDVPGLVPELNRTHRFLTPIRRMILKKAKAIVANAEGLANLSRDADPYKVDVIPNGVDANTYQPGKERREGPRRFLFVGRFQHQKNLFFLLEQFTELLKEHTAFELHIVGDGPLKAELHEVAKKAGIQEYTQWHGWKGKEELLTLYQQSDILINPSHYEGLPNVVLEGMACGLPILASNIPGNHDLVKDQDNGFLFNIGDHETYQKRLVELLHHSDLSQLGKRSREIVLERYTWESVAKSYLALLQ